jgi:hypothetical protein
MKKEAPKDETKVDIEGFGTQLTVLKAHGQEYTATADAIIVKRPDGWVAYGHEPDENPIAVAERICAQYAEWDKAGESPDSGEK